MLIPATYRQSIREVLAAAWKHFELTHRKLLVEYVLLRGLNDSAQDAKRLAGLLKGHVVAVNLLAWNPLSEQQQPLRRDLPETSVSAGKRRPRVIFQPSPPEAVAAFRDILVSERLEVAVRRSRGSDIEAACGQLAGRLKSYPQE